MTTGAATEQYQFDFLAGWLCLDLTNTMGSRVDDPPRERLTSYAVFLSWSRQAGVLSQAEAQRLLEGAARRPAEAAAVLERVRGLREAVFAVFTALERGQAFAPTDLALLNVELSVALAHKRIVPTPEGFDLAWQDDPAALDRPLWPLAESAAALLTSPERQQVHECAAPDCRWLFLDTTRNRSRRWCDMKECGNRAKARRHHQRKRGTAPPAL